MDYTLDKYIYLNLPFYINILFIIVNQLECILLINMIDFAFYYDLVYKPFYDLFIYLGIYYLVTRFVHPYLDYFYYKVIRGIPFTSFPFPVIGDYFGLLIELNKDKTKFPIYGYIRK